MQFSHTQLRVGLKRGQSVQPIEKTIDHTDSADENHCIRLDPAHYIS